MHRNEAKVFYRSVFALVVPMALQNLINVGVQSADVIMLGRVGEIVLSAASLAGQVQFILTLILFGLASGASVLTAQYWGKGDVRTIEKLVSITLRLSLLFSLPFALGALLISEVLMRIFSPDAAVIAEGVKYLRIVAISYVFIAFTNVFLNVMRSVEQVVVSTVVYFISFLTNIGLNAVLIFGLLGFPAMGIEGAALATLIARTLELVITLVYAARNPVLRLKRRDFFRWHRVLLKDFLRYATPTTLNEMVWGLAISANAVIIGHLGASAVAANSVAQVVRQLATVVCFGLANTTAIMVGKVIGGGEKKQAERYAGRFLRLTFITGALGGLIIFLIRSLVVSAMRLSPQAESYLRFLLLYMCFYVVAQAFNTTMVVGVFRGGGDTRFGLFMDATVMWLGSILWGALAAFVFHWPVEVVYIIIMSDEFIKIPLVVWRYKSKSWLRDVTRSIE